MKKSTNGSQFDPDAYKRRLKLFRELVSGENQTEFAKSLGMDFKRWNNYERGYPVPREVAFLINEKFPGMSIEWIWWGKMDNLSPDYRKKIEAAEALEREQEAVERALEKAQEARESFAAKRRKALHPPASPSRR